MPLRFTKMHGLGNDFVVVDARIAPLPLTTEQIRALADRRTGIGFDQLLILEPADDPSCVAAYSIRNADGSVAQQCGNGVRCLAAWLHRDGALRGNEARLQGPAGVTAARLLDDNRVAVDMGEPVFDPARIPFEAQAQADSHALDVDGACITVGVVSMGNPHAVIEVDDVEAPAIGRLGPLVTAHPRFPQGVNTGFVQVIDAHTLRLRVHERGAGWTRACGSGACAAVAVLRRLGRVGERVRVALPGGALEIEWPGPGYTLWMTGPATFVYDAVLAN